ncbi:restriction endonuclease subunit S [Brachyspira intermedia]|uniref:restriction endonuclease subunit S n=1 Tax=Brachyspira intermedia TaxID=84377 RepID=UPI003006A825
MTHPLPSGWQEFKLKDIGFFLRGSGISKKDLSDTGTPAIRYGDIYTKYNFVIKDISSYTNSKGTEIKKGDILFTGSGETAEEIGKSVAFIDDYKALAGGDIIIFRPNIDLNSIFLSYILNFGKCRKDISIMGQGHTVVHIYASSLEILKVILPPLDEQKRIAEVLSLCDDVIENLTELIEKKEQYKKGVMQRLLSGEVRFKGFTDKWKVFKLKEIGNIISGSGFPIKYQGKQIGEIAFIKVSDMNLKDNSIFIKKANNYINENELKELKAKIVPIDSIVFAKIGEAVKLERKRIISIKTCIDNNMSALVPFDNFNKKYIFYLLNNYKLSKHLNFSALPSLNMSDILDIEFLIPNIEEQNKISSFFSLIDEDIENLKKQLELRKQQKKGLMQKLLTGEVRV